LLSKAVAERGDHKRNNNSKSSRRHTHAKKPPIDESLAVEVGIFYMSLSLSKTGFKRCIHSVILY